jgi:glycosyltransferase involved in cell wall biosynthesis
MSAQPATPLDKHRKTPITAANATPVEGPSIRMFDGVICLGGEDWWYHNRGHFDMQMMRELSGRVPVLYVNSLGMRVPTPGEGRMFFKRVTRKVASYRRGFVKIRDNFAVASPVSVPGRVGGRLTRPLVTRQIALSARRLGIRRPLLWIANPHGARLLEDVEHIACVYQRTDRFEDFLGVDRELLIEYDRRLKSHADLTLFCSHALHEEEASACAGAAFVDHGVDYDMFREAGERRNEPEDLKDIQRPRVGFVGGIDAHTFDPELFLSVARQLPGFRFVMVGACSLPQGWCELPNVHFLGRRPYGDVARYMSACDVLIMPWNSSDWIQACNPIKLKEYLAVGRPVVSTPYPQLAPFRDLVRVASDPEAFAKQITRAIGAPHDPVPGCTRVADSTWASQADLALQQLKNLSVHAREG